jgi:hypothetical protein
MLRDIAPGLRSPSRQADIFPLAAPGNPQGPAPVPWRPAYYRRFGFELSTVCRITPPKPEWQPHFQVRVLTGYQARLRGMFTYPEPFDRT